MRIVIAKYQENIEWINDVKGFEITIYDKSKSKNDYKKLKNIGRESHTYLHHIIENYDNLDDITVFTQGHPFDHCKDFIALLDNVKDKHFYNFNILTLPTKIELNRVQRQGVTIFEDMNTEIARETLKLFKPTFNFDNALSVSYYGIFSVSRENIRKYRLEQYRKALELHTKYKDMPYIFELIWKTIFE